MKYYVVHYTKNTGRRVDLQKQFEIFGITDVEWIEVYDREDPLISKIKEVTGSPLSLGEISCTMKHFNAMERMVDGNISEAIIIEDDVVLYQEFLYAKPSHPCGLLRLCKGVGLNDSKCPPPSPNDIYRLYNSGGAEASWLSLKFANNAIKNLNFDAPFDHLQGSIIGEDSLRCMILSYQTSLLNNTGGTHGGFTAADAKIFHATFPTLKKYNFKKFMCTVKKM